MDGIRVRCGRGRPRARPGEVSGDSAYDTRGGRAYLRRRGIKANIKGSCRLDPLDPIHLDKGIKANIKGSCPSKQLWPPAPRLFHRRWEVFLWL
jgi:hypothetical protein